MLKPAGENSKRHTTAFSTDGTHHIAFSQSTDGGITWSAPIRIDKTPATSAMIPVIACSFGGRWAVTYYDNRNNTPDPDTLPTDFWVVLCSNDCGNPDAWTEKHVEGPFNARKLPLTTVGPLVGDYTGLVSFGPFFSAVYGVATEDPDNPSDIHSALIF